MNNTKIIGEAVTGERVICTHDYSAKRQPQKNHFAKWMEPDDAEAFVRFAAENKADAWITPGSDAGSLMPVTYEAGLLEKFEASR